MILLIINQVCCTVLYCTSSKGGVEVAFIAFCVLSLVWDVIGPTAHLQHCFVK